MLLNFLYSYIGNIDEGNKFHMVMCAVLGIKVSNLFTNKLYIGKTNWT